MIRLADDMGLDLVGIQDHPYQRRFLDVFTLMAWALASTQNIRVFPDVANLAMRAPAVMGSLRRFRGAIVGSRELRRPAGPLARSVMHP